MKMKNNINWLVYFFNFVLKRITIMSDHRKVSSDALYMCKKSNNLFLDVGSGGEITLAPGCQISEYISALHIIIRIIVDILRAVHCGWNTNYIRYVYIAQNMRSFWVLRAANDDSWTVPTHLYHSSRRAESKSTVRRECRGVGVAERTPRKRVTGQHRRLHRATG